jgi:plasmid stabilization system protein ParE
MAQFPKINWTKKGSVDYFSILEYWTGRNKCTVYAEKLIAVVQLTIKQLQRFPESGRKTSKQNHRYVIIDDNYLFVYKIGIDTITIMRLWHGKQNPKRIAYYR